MSCERVRLALASGAAGKDLPGPLAEHLAACPRCARFAARLEAARELLDRSAEARPDAGFAARVVAALPDEGSLGWAALRLLPATAALALVMAGWAPWSAPAADELLAAAAVEAPSEDPVAWLAGDLEVEP